ncbi:hypothetical protein L1049_023875 [Liquidambar formosana]|uniref:F-box domain-containing protein n=1 Tax=Liquidambar formosana TaxID=63359 RepID=A0AAP0RV68_LIQFO
MKGSRKRRRTSYVNNGTNRRNTPKEQKEEEEEDVEAAAAAAEAAKGRSISELPFPILIDILSRVHLKSIFRCRCVCKTWLHLILSPEFAKLHLTRAPSSLLLQLSRYRLSQRKRNDVFLLDLEAADVRHRDAKFRFNPNLNSLNLRRCQLADSCNGFLCLADICSGNPLYILNPLTGDYITLPQVQKGFVLCESRFGFCPNTNQYKVVRFVHTVKAPRPDEWEIEIYTLGTASWRSTGFSQKSACPPRCDCLLNGSLHWVLYYGGGLESICSFHIGNETFQTLPIPPLFDLCVCGGHKRSIRGLNLGVFDGYLCICGYDSKTHYGIWVMKEYGVQESWSKLFVIEISVPARNVRLWWADYIPIKFLNDGGLLMLRNGETLVSYSFKERSFEMVRNRIPQFFEAVSHSPSFLSFKDIAMGENLKVLNVKPR